VSTPAVDELLRLADEQPFESWNDDLRGRLSFATLFSGDETPTRSLTSGLAVMSEGGWLGLHRHTAVETYFVLAGTGLLTLNGQEIEIGPGSAVLIPSDAEHGVRNTGVDELRVHYVFSADAMSDIVYRFSADPRN
jgi:mannose-6-phosphate isomerase-like protein (cupin superfamily)